MVPANSKGQIILEVAVVALALVLIFLGAMTQFSETKKSYRKYQFTEENKNVRKNSSPIKK